MNPLPPLPLLIGIGNRLRRDDGVGYRIAETLRAEGSPLQVLAVQQLTPELAEPIAAAAAVLFVDASVCSCERLRLDPLPAADAPGGAQASRAPLSHHVSPLKLLQLSQGLYGRWPPAWQLLIPVQDLEVGERLSPVAAGAMAEALTLVRRWRAGHA